MTYKYKVQTVEVSGELAEIIAGSSESTPPEHLAPGEKRNAREGFGIAGLRSFVMLAQIGAVGGYLAHRLNLPWLLAAVLVGLTPVMHDIDWTGRVPLLLSS